MKICVLVCLSNQTILRTLQRLHDDFKNNIQFFLYHDGVYLLNESAFVELTKHVKTTLCSVSAEERNIKKSENVVFGSLYDLSTILSNSDKLISLTRET